MQNCVVLRKKTAVNLVKSLFAHKYVRSLLECLTRNFNHISVNCLMARPEEIALTIKIVAFLRKEIPTSLI